MKIVFFGTPSFVVPVLESLNENFDVVAVVTTPDVLTGRKKILTPSPVKAHYNDYLTKSNKGGTVITDQQWNNGTMKQLTTLHPDLFVVAAYGHLIPEHVLKIPKLGSLNIHPSLLPKYRGPSPIQTAILNGDNETGVTIIQMDKELDHGPIVIQRKIQLKGDETFESLHNFLFQRAAALLPSTIEQYSNKTITPTAQDESKATYCEKISKENGYFDPNNPPAKETLDRMIRAYYPWPTAWSKWPASPKLQRGEQMANSPRASLASRRASVDLPRSKAGARRGEAGGKWQIVKFLPQKMIQLEGGRPMKVKDFLNGYPELKSQLEKLFG